MIRFLQIIIVSIVLAGCAFKPSIDDAKLSDKTFELEKFFDGKVKASCRNGQSTLCGAVRQIGSSIRSLEIVYSTRR